MFLLVDKPTSSKAFSASFQVTSKLPKTSTKIR
jgi:hypothetical protein